MMNGNRWLKPSRVGVIALHTFTQLVRMKVFYFLMVFGVLLIAVNFLDLPQFQGPESMNLGELRILKETCTGVMKLFAVVFAIAATALLLPKDVEDRTLYTILAKPVPRLDYLVGKLAGVLLLVFVSLLVMNLLMNGAVAWRCAALVQENLDIANRSGWSQREIDALTAEIRQHGVTWSLQSAMWVIFLQACLVGATALLLSTFSSSTLFTIIVSFLIFLIGHLQSDAANFYRATAEGTSKAGLWFTKIVSLAFPDHQLFNVIEASIQGQVIKMADIAALTGLTCFYVVLYTLLSWFVFRDKEF
jgi:ABC-type transport system involved in multi-copper enzyme maturation permease subunit